MRLLIAGAGGHGRVVADLAAATGRYSSIAFVDDRHPQLAESAIWPVVGVFAGIDGLRGDFDAFAAAIGDSRLRVELIGRASRLGFDTSPLIHPAAHVSGQASLGCATVVCAGAVVGIGAVLGSGCIVNTCASVDHDCRLGEGVHVAPGAHLGGHVSIGDRTWVGIGASIRQQVAIGCDVIVAAGAVCVTDIESGVTVMGVPARPSGRTTHRM